MEEKDPVGNKFRSAFAEFEQEPPAEAWERLRRELHPEPKTTGIWSTLMSFSFSADRRIGFYLSLGAFILILLLAVVYVASNDRYMIQGRAYTGDVRLCRGTAVLFSVSDKAVPWDSAAYYRSAIVDVNGHFQFPGIKPGKYLLRVAPEGNSETARKFSSSWYDQHVYSGSGHLIIISGNDVNADVHLVKKRE